MDNVSDNAPQPLPEASVGAAAEPQATAEIVPEAAPQPEQTNPAQTEQQAQAPAEQHAEAAASEAVAEIIPEAAPVEENLHHLHAPDGTDEANFGTERFHVDNDGNVDVPAEAVAGLVGTGGFEEVKPAVDDAAAKHEDAVIEQLREQQAERHAQEETAKTAGEPQKPAEPVIVPQGFGLVRHADANASCSRGVRQDDGSFLVPIEDVNELCAHGFVPVEVAPILQIEN